MKTHKCVRLLGLLCVGLLFVSLTGWAQERASIVGTVTDASAAVMPGVRIVVTDTGTGVARTVESNAEGSYSAPGLVPGTYEIRAEAKGFKTYTRTGVVLNVRDMVRVDISMVVGEITQTVEVTEGVVKVQTESAEVSDLISGSQITQLSINARNFMNLATLTPGASSNLPDFNLPIPVGGDSTISFNGNRNHHNVWMIDGGENYDRGCGGCVSVMPSMDALAEFKVMTSNAGADFGIASGGTVNMALKSGTQNYHGTVYEFVRNDDLDANNFMSNRAGAPKPHLRYNNFGWNVGGPVIPKSSKNKTFFFFNQEWRKIRQGVTRTANSPSAAMRNGDFSALLPGTQLTVPTAAQVGDPATIAAFAAEGLAPGDPIPGNIIPASLINPSATAFFGTGAIPLPNSGSLFVGSRAVPIDVREEIIRVDHSFNEKVSLMAHFINDAVVQETDTTLWAGMSYPTLGTIFRNPAKHGVLRLTWMLSPSVLNEVAYNYNGNRIDLTPNGVFAKPSGFNVQEFFSGNSLDRLPVIQFRKQMNTAYDSGSWPWHNAADSQQVRDDVSWIVGKHSLKFGGQLMRYRKNQDIFGQTQGNYRFDGTFTGSDVADFLLGFTQSYSELAIQDRGHWRNTSLSFYFTDSWRATPRLTWNLGVRWEVLPHVYEVVDRMSNFYPDLYDPSQAPFFIGTSDELDTSGPGFTTVSGVPLSTIPFYMNGVGLAGKDGIPRGLVTNYYNTIGPRVGFAYDLTGDGKTVVRGGFGMFYERIQGNDVYDGGPNPPFSFNPAVNNVFLSDPSIALSDGQKAAVPIFPASFRALDRAYLVPTSQQWNFGIQHELGPRTVLSVAYVGNSNIHQRIQRNINQPLTGRTDVRDGSTKVNTVRPFPGFGAIVSGENSTSGNYHSLQANFRIDNVRGLTFQSSYTWAKSIDYTFSDNAGNAYDAYDLSKDRALSDLDRRHILVMNYIYELPFFRSHPNAFARQTLGGWQISGITMFQTGLPNTATFPGDIAGVGLGNIRADLVGDPNSGPKTIDEWFNKSAFAAPITTPVDPSDPLTFGSSGRNVIRRPGRNNWNLSLFKVISLASLTEGAQLQFRFETFNSLNHTQFNNYDANFASGNFGKITSTYDARRIQFGLKFSF